MLAPWGRGMLSGFGAVTATSLTTTGDITSTSGNLVGKLKGQRHMQTTSVESTGGLLLVSGRCYAQYVGRVNGPYTALDVHVYVGAPAAVAGGGGASLNWAEIGIATSSAADLFTASVDLTILAAASIDTEVKAGSTVDVMKSLSGLTIAAGTDLWVVCAAAYQTTMPTMRYPSEADNQGHARTRNSCQPSANLSTPLTFTGTPGTALAVPIMRAQLA